MNTPRTSEIKVFEKTPECKKKRFFIDWHVFGLVRSIPLVPEATYLVSFVDLYDISSAL